MSKCSARKAVPQSRTADRARVLTQAGSSVKGHIFSSFPFLVGVDARKHLSNVKKISPAYLPLSGYFLGHRLSFLAGAQTNHFSLCRLLMKAIWGYSGQYKQDICLKTRKHHNFLLCSRIQLVRPRQEPSANITYYVNKCGLPQKCGGHIGTCFRASDFVHYLAAACFLKRC